MLKILKRILKVLARAVIHRYRPTIIGVTGNVGKTSTKEAIRIVLSGERRVRAPLKSFNNELGMPFTILSESEFGAGLFFWCKTIVSGLSQLVLKNRAYPEILVLEYGVDKPGDMKYLLEIARPQIALVTAIGEVPVHVEFFGGPEELAREKSKLISQLPSSGFAVLNADDAAVLRMKNDTRAKILTFGFSETADLTISNFSNNFDSGEFGANFKLSQGGASVPVRLKNVLGKAQSYATAGAAATGLIFDMNLIKIAEALAFYKPPAGRFRIIKGVKESTIIDDTYNASPLAMREALTVLRDLPAQRKIAVLGDMLEIGEYTVETHEAIGRLAAEGVQMLITIGERGKFIAEAAKQSGFSKESIFVFESVSEAGKFLQENIRVGDIILVKASQAVRLEKIVKEVMAEPNRAAEFLVRQNKEWLAKKGLYD